MNRALLTLLILPACTEPSMDGPSPHNGIFETNDLEVLGPPTQIDTTLTLSGPGSVTIGETAIYRVAGAQPGQIVRLAGSYQGTGGSTFCPSWLNRNCTDLSTIGRLFDSVADANGEAIIERVVSPTSFATVYLQAYARRDRATLTLPNKSPVKTVQLQQPATGLPSDVLVGDIVGDSIISFSATGTLNSVFVDSADVGDLNFPWDLARGPDGDIYVTSGSRVKRYDGETGVFVENFVDVGAGLSSSQGLSFGPDGHLYVSSPGTPGVLRFDGETGDFIDVFVDSPSGSPVGHFWHQGDLFLATGSPGNHVLRFDGTDGTAMGVFIDTAHLIGVYSVVRSAAGQWFVSSATSSTIQRYDDNGNHLGAFGSGHFAPRDLAIRGNELYVTDAGLRTVRVYNLSNGTLNRDFATSAAHPQALLLR